MDSYVENIGLEPFGKLDAAAAAMAAGFMQKAAETALPGCDDYHVEMQVGFRDGTRRRYTFGRDDAALPRNAELKDLSVGVYAYNLPPFEGELRLPDSPLALTLHAYSWFTRVGAIARQPAVAQRAITLMRTYLSCVAGPVR